VILCKPLFIQYNKDQIDIYKHVIVKISNQIFTGVLRQITCKEKLKYAILLCSKAKISTNTLREKV